MRITLVGSRHFGVTTLDMLRQHGVEIARVVVADADDRLATAARAAGIEVAVQANPKLVVAAGNRRRHRPDRDRAQPRPHQQGSPRRGQTRRHRLSPLAAAAAPRHRRGRMDDPGGRSDRRRHRLSSGRSHGCRRDRRAGVVFRQEGRDRAASCGNARWRRSARSCWAK